MKQRDKQLQRLIYFVDEAKKGKYPNASQFVKHLKILDEKNGTSLACSTKTINRDIQYLSDELSAPIEYDPTEKGYYLWMKEWTFPELALGRDELFAELFTKQLSANSILPCLKEHLNSSSDIQMTAGESDDIDCSALGSVIHATGKVINIDTQISEQILTAWKSCFQVKSYYSKRSHEAPEERHIEIHALFLSNSVWYCHAYCHKRKAFRNFALHKFNDIQITKVKFQRSLKAVASLKKGQLFEFPTIQDITIHCDAEAADYIRDREWFDSQKIEDLEDGKLKVHFNEVPKDTFIWWILSFSGKLELISPLSLREEVKLAAQKLFEKHS